MSETSSSNPVTWLGRKIFMGLFTILVAGLLLPFSLVMLILFLAVDFVLWPAVAIFRRRGAMILPPVERKREASIIIVSVEGKELLARCLPALTRAMAFDGGDHEIIVVDNGSSDGSVAWLEKEWPSVKVVALDRNHFFGGGNREGIKAATKDFVIFLNNDMVVEENFLTPLFEGFTSPEIMAVSAEIFFTDESKRREETGKTRAEWKRGEMILKHVMPGDVDLQRERVPCFWAGGGSSAYDRRLFLALGQFESLYDPFYMEDTGVSYQAWKRGYQVVFEPRSRVAHEHRTTGRRLFGERYIDGTTRRNYYLFMWRNITDFSWTLQHFVYFPQKFFKAAKRKDLSFECVALGRALLKLPQALWLRQKSRFFARRSDKEVFRLSSSNAEYDAAFGRPERDGPLKILMFLARLPKQKLDGSWILFNLIRRLGQRHELSVVSFIDTPDERQYMEDLEPFCHELKIIQRQQNPSAHNLHRLIPGRLVLDYTDPRMLECLRDRLEDSDFDIIQCEYIEMAHMFPYVRRLPSLFTHHEVMAVTARRALWRAEGLFEKWKVFFESLQYLRYELEICRKFKRVVTLSDFDQQALESYDGRVSAQTIPSGIELDAYQDWPRPVEREKPHIVFVGYYLHPPNVDAAMFLCQEIFPRVLAERPDAKLFLIGREAPPALEHAVETQAGASLTGFVDSLDPYMEEASVIAIPIRKGAGLRGKFLEAWAMGKAVVSTQVAAQGFRAESGKHLLIEDEAEPFAKAILNLLEDRERRQSMGLAARKLVEETYSDQAMARSFERLYADLLGRSSVRGLGKPAPNNPLSSGAER